MCAQFEQLSYIFSLCGSADELNWPGVSKLPYYGQFKPERPSKRRIRDQFKGCGLVLCLVGTVCRIAPQGSIRVLHC